MCNYFNCSRDYGAPSRDFNGAPQRSSFGSARDSGGPLIRDEFQSSRDTYSRDPPGRDYPPSRYVPSRDVGLRDNYGSRSPPRYVWFFFYIILLELAPPITNFHQVHGLLLLYLITSWSISWYLNCLFCFWLVEIYHM